MVTPSNSTAPIWTLRLLAEHFLALIAHSLNKPPTRLKHPPPSRSSPPLCPSQNQ